MTTEYDILAILGTDIVLRFTALDNNNNPIDLTNYNANGFVRLRYSDTGAILNLNPIVNVSGVLSGWIDVIVPATGFSGLPITQALYDIKIQNVVSGYVTQVVQGYFNIMPAATI